MNLERILDCYTDNVIITGENGTGKSRVLRELYFNFKGGSRVVPIVNTPSSKIKSRNLFKVQSSAYYAGLLKKFFRFQYEKDYEVHIDRCFSVLNYAGFDERVGFDFFLDEKKYFDHYEEGFKDLKVFLNKEEFHYIVSALEFLIKNQNEDVPKIQWILKGVSNFHDYFFNILNNHDISLILKYESRLRKLGLIKSYDAFLSKKEDPISIDRISSGEASLIFSSFHLSCTLSKSGNVILIDEPENSLHPKWQKEYFRNIIELFYLFNVKIIVATHSPFIISGAAEYIGEELTVFGIRDFESGLERLEPEDSDFEAMIWSFFGVATPESNFLSRHFVRLLNDLSNERISFINFKYEYSVFYESSYSDKQKNTLNKIMEVANSIARRARD